MMADFGVLVPESTAVEKCSFSLDSAVLSDSPTYVMCRFVHKRYHWHHCMGGGKQLRLTLGQVASKLDSFCLPSCSIHKYA